MPAAPAIPLADVADRWLAELARESAAVAALNGATLLGERAAAAGLRVPGRVSAGGGCRLYEARGGLVALNLARTEDRELLPALFEAEGDVAALVATRDAAALVARGRAMGLAIAHEGERAPPALAILAKGSPGPPPARPPRVLDLSALWAGPLAAHLLGAMGADVVKAEAASRPDPMQHGRDAALFATLDAGKRHATFDPARGAETLTPLLAEADIVIEAARPRALRQLGIDADAWVAARPGRVWITITGHGASGAAADGVAFGDDAGVAGGLTAAMRRASGRAGFVGDAIADPLTGILAAREAWRRWRSGHGARIGLAMSGVAAAALADARAHDAAALDAALRDWAAAEGAPFPAAGRSSAPVWRRAPC